MKRVIAILLCLLCAMCVLVACGDKQNEEHTHTYKTDADWTHDAEAHWYEATCECEDPPIRKLAHTDANNDGACDVCKFVKCEHTFAEGYTADCTNHWHAADCGHVVDPNQSALLDKTAFGKHEDNDEDGKCDVCNYIIEDLHNHYFSTEWTSDGEYHWHAALCEHQVEVADKAAHEINAAGYCTVCDAKIKDIDRTDILAVLNAAIANNYKVISGNVIFNEIVYDTPTELLDKGTDEVFFVLGKEDSYILLKNYDENDNFIGGEQQYYETLENGEMFGIMVPIGSIDLRQTSADAVKLNGYNYTPGSILAAGYDDTSTLAQTIANLYDLMTNSNDVKDVVTNYDPKTGKYSFSFEYLSVNATEQSPSDGSGGESVMDYQVYVYFVDVEFTVNDDFVIDLCNFSVESYRNWEMDTDITYDPETNTYEMLSTASPTYYVYEVSQTSGERTFTTIYPKASLMPVDFELFFVTETDYNAGQMYVKDETPIVDIDGDGIVDLELTKETFIRLHIGNVIPSSAIPSFMDMEDFEVICENLDEGNGLLWGTGLFQDPTFSGFMDCISFRTSSSSGKYLITIRFGQVTKKVCVTIPGTPTIVVPDDTDDTKYVQVTTPWGFEDQYTFTAKESGTYTFTLPAGLGFVFENADTPEYDPFDPVYSDNNEHTVVFELAQGESVSFFVGAEEKGVFAIGVAFEAGEVGGGDDDQGGTVTPPAEINIIGTYKGGNVTVVIDETNVTFTSDGYNTVAQYEIVDGAVVLYQADGTIWGSFILAVNLTNGAVTSIVYNGRNINVTVADDDNTGDDNTGDDNTGDENEIEISGMYIANGYQLYFLHTDDKNLLNIYGTGFDLYFTYIVTENLDGTYAIIPTYYARPDFESGTDMVETIENEVFIAEYDGAVWTFQNDGSGDEGGDTETDPLKEAVLGEYVIDGYNVYIYNNGEYFANVYGTGFDLYFTYEVTDNGDGSYTLALTYFPRPDFESGTNKVDEILALDITVTPSGSDDEETKLEDSLAGEHTSALNDLHLFFYKSEDGIYYMNVYGGSADIYYTYIAVDNGDGTVSITPVFATEHPNNEGQTDVYELEGATIIATKDESTWTFELASEEEETAGTYDAPIEITEAGNYVAPFKGGYNYVYYKYTVNANGYVTISTTHTAPYFQYGTSIDNLTNNEGPSGTLSSVKTYAFAGQTIYIAIGDGNFAESAMDIPFSVSFEAFESGDASFLEGTWSGEKAGMFGSTPYTFVIGANGTGTGTYTEMNYSTEFTIDFILVNGNNVTIYVTTLGWFAQELSFSFTYNEETDALESAAMTLTQGTGDDGDDDEDPVTPPPAEPNGTKNNPYIVGTLPFSFTLGGGHDCFYKLVATEDATIVITYADGCYISDLPSSAVKDSANFTYTFDVKAGDEIVFNPWTSRASGEYTYTVAVAEPVVTPDPDEPGEGGDVGGNVVTYISEKNGSRYIQFSIDGSTLTVTRSDMTGNFGTGGASTAVFTYVNNGVDSTATRVSGTACTFTFGEDGLPISIAWNGVAYINFTVVE